MERSLKSHRDLNTIFAEALKGHVRKRKRPYRPKPGPTEQRYLNPYQSQTTRLYTSAQVLSWFKPKRVTFAAAGPDFIPTVLVNDQVVYSGLDTAAAVAAYRKAVSKPVGVWMADGMAIMQLRDIFGEDDLWRRLEALAAGEGDAQ